MAETGSRTAVFTIVSKNYWHHARVLMASLAKVHPGWERYVLLCDGNDGEIEPDKEMFEVTPLETIGLPEFRKFCFRYTILELNTAVKPWMFEWLFSRGYSRVVYLDPDIVVYGQMAEVEKAFDSGALMVLTPHLTAPLDDGKKPSDLDILIAGSYNLGFLALARRPELDSMLRWWKGHLERECVVDFSRGLFVDQKWMDMAPGLFGSAAILRHPGYNVAYWNLLHRELRRTAGAFTVNGEPLVFFHFSGLNIKRPGPFSKHQNRFTLDTIGDARFLVDGYLSALNEADAETCRLWPYAFARFDEGTPIPDFVRRIYRENPSLETEAGTNPFASWAWLSRRAQRDASGGDPPVTILMEHTWLSRPDVKAVFPEPFGRDRRPFASWFANSGPLEHGLPEIFVLPLLQRLEGGPRPAACPPPLSFFQRFFSRFTNAGADASSCATSNERASLEARAGDNGDALPPGVNYAGFYDEEEFPDSPRAVWMGGEGSIYIPWPAEGPLRISGVYSAECFRLAHGSNKTRVDVIVGKEVAGSFDLESSGPFEVEVPLRGRQITRDAVLVLKPSGHFVPAKIANNGDTRCLTLRIAKVELGGRPLLDFDMTENPFVPYTDAPSTRAGINLAGYAKGEFGVGQSVRCAASALDAAGIPFMIVDFNEGSCARTDDVTWAHKISGKHDHAINVMHINADQMPVAYSQFGEAFFKGRYNIGYWAWELPEFPDRWVQAFAYVDEVWSPSRFCASSIGAKSPVPVLAMPHAIRFSASPDASRSRFGLPDGRFLFLTMYDMNSFQDRKNPEGAIQAFMTAFAGDSSVGLVVKTQNTSFRPGEYARLKAAAEKAPGIYLIDRTLTRQDIYDLESLVDCFVSLHRSEGFGLGLAECMYLGKPVVGTAWSGNMDFMNHRNSCLVDYHLTEIKRDAGPYRRGQIWAEPHVDDAAQHMAHLVKDRSYRERIARAAAKTMREEFSPDAVGALYQKRLTAIERILKTRRPGHALSERGRK